MGEELIQKGLSKNGIKLLNYEYYNIGATTLTQLKNKRIIPDRNYGRYEKRKPDGLLVDRRNKKDVKVIAVVEYKKPSEFRTNSQQTIAIQQGNDLSQVLDANIGIITDGEVTFWINPKHSEKENEYFDKTSNKKRGYSFIQNEDKKQVSLKFSLQSKDEENFDKLDEETKDTFYLINRILESINEKNSRLKANEEVDPLPLAKSVWQDIYANTGKDPTKCLYNVVELFIFKFLSDLRVLKSPFDLDSLMEMYEKGNNSKDVLSYYARNSRPEMIKLFPKGDDGTTIINGTIFVDSKGNPVQGQANLFKNSLQKYKEFGSLKNIKKEFKTKLFETFLKQSQDKSKLGQFFTPRKVIQAIVDMADVENIGEGSRICDPFCGVGGFILETLQKPRRKKDFFPKKGKIEPPLFYRGYDKGTGDDDEERTIILAKANMLIYLSEIVEKNPTLTKEFSKIFNNTFKLLAESNLGTLRLSTDKEEERYDLILTNPPYIKSGVRSLKTEITSEGLSEYYTAGGSGVEGLALEWIIRNLKKGGRAFIVLPDSILTISHNENLRKFLLENCFLDVIISLPTKTFFNTPKKTYIVGITKKEKNEQIQNFPVFTYLVSDIGESLDSNRLETEGKSDLQKAKELYNMYKGSSSKKDFPIKDIGDPRCKIVSIEEFAPKEFWNVDKFWDKEEKISLGIEEEEQIVDIEEFKEKIEDFSKKLKEYNTLLEDI